MCARGGAVQAEACVTRRRRDAILVQDLACTQSNLAAEVQAEACTTREHEHQVCGAGFSLHGANQGAEVQAEACTTSLCGHIPADSTAPRPTLRGGTEPSFHGVQLDVSHESIEVIGRVNQVIERLAFPERARARQVLIDPSRCCALPAAQDHGRVGLTQRREDHMHVVRHDAPGHQLVGRAVVAEEYPLDGLRNGRRPKDTRAQREGRIVACHELLGSDLRQLRSWARRRTGRWADGIEQPPRYEQAAPWLVQVRELTASAQRDKRGFPGIDKLHGYDATSHLRCRKAVQAQACTTREREHEICSAGFSLHPDSSRRLKPALQGSRRPRPAIQGSCRTRPAIQAWP